MTRVLITGANSYIGTALRSALAAFPGQYACEEMDLHGEGWRARSFAGYDVVFHVAGIAHADAKGENDPGMRALYQAVNAVLPVETAKKAKADGVGLFIFMSSIIVYGEGAPLGGHRVITRDTLPAPDSQYGLSKWQAEEGLRALEGEGFRVAVLRPPMVYGRGCRGNYPTLAKLARALPVFPRVDNERSMLYVENLTAFVRHIIDQRASGVFFPQNARYACTSELVRLIAREHGRGMLLVPGLGWALRLLSRFTPLVNKAFGSQTYALDMSRYPLPYQLYDLEESIRRSEGKS